MHQEYCNKALPSNKMKEDCDVPAYLCASSAPLGKREKKLRRT